VTSLLLALLLAQDDATIKVNVNLVQIDVTVTGKAGEHIEGLKAEDFEVFRDGKRQPVTNAVWVGKRPGLREDTLLRIRGSAGPTPLRQLRKDEIRRTVILFVDDLSLSPAGLYYTQDALKKFVEANLQEGDLVALFRSSTGVSFTQQFSNDRNQLLEAIARLKFRSILGVDALAPIQNNAMEDSGDSALAEEARRQRLREEAILRERQDMITAGVLNSLNFLIQGVRDLPGRKSVVLFSESVQLFDAPQSMFNPLMNREEMMRDGAQGGQRARTANALRGLTDLANRHGVVLYAIDPRGVQTLGITAQDMPSVNVRRLQGQMMQRSYEFNASQDGMSVMAEDTGGLFFRGTNDITAALAAAVSDQEEYYLVGFRPDDETFEKSKGAARFHRLEIKVKKPGVKVRFRKGFFGVTDEERLPKERPAILTAMMSPFRSVEVPLKLTPVLRLDGKEVAGVLRALVHIDISAFAFKDLENEQKESQLEAAVYLFNLDGGVVDNLVKTYNVKLGKEAYRRALATGLVQELEVGIAKAGSYQIRAAVRDIASDRVGSAVQFIQVPDPKKGKLESSDLIVNGDAWEKGESDFSGPALRQMRQGETVKYAILLYNTKLGPDGKPKLESQVSIYKDGRLVHRGPLLKLDMKEPHKGESLTLSGAFKLGNGTSTGEYAIELAIRDALAPKKEQFALRTTTFEVIPKI
jgi:VWFA-related protein